MVISRLMLAFLIVLLFAGSISPQILPVIVKGEQMLSIESGKVNSWLRNEVETWLSTDPFHRVSMIAWLNENYLKNNKITQSRVADHFAAEYNATIRRIGFLPFITADVPCEMIDKIAQEQVVDVLVSAIYPILQLPSVGPQENAAASVGSASFANTTLENSVRSVDGPRVWKMGYTGQGMKIAIIDSGINSSLPDGSLRPDLLFSDGTSKIVNQMDFTDDGDTLDYACWTPTLYGHGTWVAITAAGSGRYSYFSSMYGNITSMGVAPAASIFNLKVFNKSNATQVEWVTAAIDYAVMQGVDVINMSLGDRFGTQDDPFSIAADQAVSDGVVVVTSAGNDGALGFGHLSSPGCAFNVTTVGSVGANNTVSICDDALDPNSSKGPTPDGRTTKPDLVAPGANQVYLAYADGASSRVMVLSGTSFSAPHVSGIAVLVRQAHPDWDPIMVNKALSLSARLNDYIWPLKESERGKGIVSAYGAVLNASAADFSVVSIEPTPPQYSVFQVYHDGMWLDGVRITMNYDVTVARAGAYVNDPYYIIAKVGLKRTSVDDPSREKVVNESTIVVLSVEEQTTKSIAWNETSTMQTGNWRISAFVEPISIYGYYDGWPEDNSKDSTTSEARVLVGDATGSGHVDLFDGIIVASSFGKLEGQDGYKPDANFCNAPDRSTGKQIIDIFDGIIFTSHFNWDIYGPPRGGKSSPRGMVVTTDGSPGVTLDPSEITVFEGEVFSVNVTVTDATDLYGWEFKLYWNKTLLNCTGYTMYTPTEWQGQNQTFGPCLEATFNDTSSRYWQGQAAVYPASSFTGSMTMVTLTFQAMQLGTTSLTLADVKLGNSSGQQIECVFSSGSVSVYYDRYMRSDAATVNGLNAYILNATETASYTYVQQVGQGLGAEFGIRAWVRASNGTEYEVTLDGQTGTPKATVTTTGWGTVNVTQMSMETTFSFVIRVYVRIAGGAWTDKATFTTGQLGKTSLLGTTWSVYYHVSTSYYPQIDRTTARFYWGDASHMSRLQNLQFT